MAKEKREDFGFTDAQVFGGVEQVRRKKKRKAKAKKKKS